MALLLLLRPSLNRQLIVTELYLLCLNIDKSPPVYLTLHLIQPITVQPLFVAVKYGPRFQSFPLVFILCIEFAAFLYQITPPYLYRWIA